MSNRLQLDFAKSHPMQLTVLSHVPTFALATVFLLSGGPCVLAESAAYRERLMSSNKCGVEEAQRELVSKGLSSIPIIKDMLDDGVPLECLSYVIEQLGRKAEPLIPELVAKLDRPNEVLPSVILLGKIKTGSLAALDQDDRRRGAKAMSDAVLDKKLAPMTRTLNASFLPQAFGKESEPYIVLLLQHSEWQVRATAAKSVLSAPFGSALVERKVIELLEKDDSMQVRESAATALLNAKYHSLAAANALARAVHEYVSNNDARKLAENAASSLGTYGSIAVDILVPELEQSSSRAGYCVRRAWSSNQDSGTLNKLIGLLDHECEQVRMVAETSLTIAANKRLSQELMNQTASQRRRQAVVRKLGAFAVPDVEVSTELSSIALDKQQSQLLRVDAAYASLTTSVAAERTAQDLRSVIPTLVAALTSDDFLMRGKAAETLGKLGPVAKESLPSLRAALQPPPDSFDTQGIRRDYVATKAEEAIESLLTEDLR